MKTEEVLKQALNELFDNTKGLCEIQKTIIIDQDKLEKRIKKLEERDSYYPNENEVRRIKVGGTD